MPDTMPNIINASNESNVHALMRIEGMPFLLPRFYLINESIAGITSEGPSGASTNPRLYPVATSMPNSLVLINPTVVASRSYGKNPKRTIDSILPLNESDKPPLTSMNPRIQF